MTAPALNVAIQGEGEISADNLNTYQQTCDTIADLRDFIGAPGVQVLARGLVTAGDGGAGLFYWVEGGTAADDGLTVIVPDGATGLWLRFGVLIQPYQTVTTGDVVDILPYVGFVFVQKVGTGNPVQLNLPGAPLGGLPIVVIDAKGDAAFHNVTISGNGKTINGAATAVINTAYGNKKLVYNTYASAWYTW